MLTQYCKAKKILFFPEILVARNIFTQMTANLFFQSIFQIYYLVFFSFFSFFYYFFVCCFLKLKIILWYTFNYAGGWVLKKFSRSQFSETRLLFSAQGMCHLCIRRIDVPTFAAMRMTVSGFLWTLSWHQHIHWTWLYTDMNDPDKF